MPAARLRISRPLEANTSTPRHVYRGSASPDPLRQIPPHRDIYSMRFTGLCLKRRSSLSPVRVMGILLFPQDTRREKTDGLQTYDTASKLGSPLRSTAPWCIAPLHSSSAGSKSMTLITNELFGMKLRSRMEASLFRRGVYTYAGRVSAAMMYGHSRICDDGSIYGYRKQRRNELR